MASWEMCQHRAGTSVLVFGIRNTSGCAGFASTPGLLWVVIDLGGVSPPFEMKPMVENNLDALRCIPCKQMSIYLCTLYATVVVQLCSYMEGPLSGQPTSTVEVSLSHRLTEEKTREKSLRFPHSW